MTERNTYPTIVRMRVAFDLFEAGVQVKRAQLRRQHPGADEAEIEQRLGAWLQHRPGAEHGDAEGRPCQLGSRRPT